MALVFWRLKLLVYFRRSQQGQALKAAEGIRASHVQLGRDRTVYRMKRVGESAQPGNESIVFYGKHQIDPTGFVIDFHSTYDNQTGASNSPGPVKIDEAGRSFSPPGVKLRCMAVMTTRLASETGPIDMGSKSLVIKENLQLTCSMYEEEGYHAPLNFPCRFSRCADMASRRSSEGMIMLDLAALKSRA